MYVKAPLSFGRQECRAVPALRALKKVIRSRSLMVVMGLTLSGVALAQQYFRFELVDSAFNAQTGGTGDFHILIGELAVGSSNNLTVPVFNPTPPTFSDVNNWSSNIGSPAGKGGVLPGAAVNRYGITRIGGDANGAFATYGGGTTSRYIATLNMGWTDASGASYFIAGTSDGTIIGSNWTLYNATWNGTAYTYNPLTDSIPAPNGSISRQYLFVLQATDGITGSFSNGTGIENGYGPNLLPEIDASAMPKALLLLGSVLLLVRSRRCA
jgi:hypothetical protein